MSIKSIEGIIVPIVTPVDENERIDIVALNRILDYVIKGGVHGVLIFGNQYESFDMTCEEKINTLTEIVSHFGKKVPIYIRVDSISTKQCISSAILAKEVGIDGIFIQPPMHIGLNEDELFTHIIKIANTVEDLSIILNNDLLKTGYSLSPSLIEKLADVENILGVNNSNNDLYLTSEYVRRTVEKEFNVMIGNDNLILGGLVYGAKGAVASTANIVPELVLSIYNKYIEENIDASREAQFKLTTLKNILDKTSLSVAIKDACNIIGLNLGDNIRPSTSSPMKVLSEIRLALKNIDYID